MSVFGTMTSPGESTVRTYVRFKKTGQNAHMKVVHRTLELEKEFDASPPAAVFAAYVDPEQGRFARRHGQRSEH